MKKSFFLVPLAAVVLAACSSSQPAPVESASDDTTLSPGIMQPVTSTGAANGAWEPEIQQQSMPNTMNVPSAQVPTVQPAAPQPMPQPVQQAQQTVASSTAKAKQVSQDFTIPRNAQTNAPDYSKIDKGFYKGDTYTVRKGDTMFLIAYISGMDVKELAALNNMSEPYNLSIGQTLRVSNNTAPAAATTAAVTQAPAPVPAKPVEPSVTYTPAANGTQYGSDGTVTGPIKAGVGTAATVGAATVPAVRATAGTPPATTSAPTVTATAPAATQTVTQAPAASNIAWRWPASGKIIQGFSNTDGGNKGIDIGGSRGQAVNAAAAGTVVYAGNALRGYGNLIIIKHNDDYLSAYAHNESILVKEQQQVKSGQQIAKMGSSGTNGVKLHFEIRYKGKSVDPIRYLPRR
ncbi:murein hydrolase activator NlpD [Conservatibacter flavescens]|uniref:Murein hydrolase activator NlpD n=1 Tax=Conservatibacter flavescens TaxID=28161 RepID=A0A2M8RZI0_9PAST|nr:murein hydrolase activator NlpD [Conservatibacter flavescens]PJG84300.1 murein hydrolase activator NlpD [Conservatibacter flavescens]